MSIFKVKLRATDRLWTQYMRLLYDYTCQWCGRPYSPDDTARLQNLGVSHYYSRGHENTRFDVDNTLPFCNLPCHRYLDNEGRAEYTEFMIKRLGQEGFDMLNLKAHIRKDRDDVSDKIIIKAMLEEFEGNIILRK